MNGDSSDPVRGLVRRLRDGGRFPEVRSSFWKEEPLLPHAFLLMESREVVAIPVFTSEGYFTERVLPRELGIDPPASWTERAHLGGASVPEGDSEGRPVADQPEGRVFVRYTRPVGTHPAMAGVLLERARECLVEHGLVDGGDVSGPPDAPEDLTLLVLGHGTERHPASGEVTERLTAELAGSSGFAHVTCAFLDQEPRLESVLAELETPRAVVVPFFIAEGWHVGETIPEDLNLEEGRGRGVAKGIQVFFAGPAGTHPAMARVVEELVSEALEETPMPATPAGSLDSPPLPVRAREAFLAWIDEGGSRGRRFLQTRVARTSTSDPPRYEIRHWTDRGADPSGLVSIYEPEQFSEWARWDEEGRYRPLTTAPSLAPGRIARGLDGREVWEAYAILYPAAPIHWFLGREGRLPTGSFEATADRQTGIYQVVVDLSSEQVRATGERCCGADGCLRAVRWSLGEESDVPGGKSARIGGEAVVPCPEPCTLFVAAAREEVVGKGH